MPVNRSSTKSNFENTMESNTFSCESRYRQRCPPSLSINRYQPYQTASITHLPSPASEECVNILSKMNHRVSEEGFYIPSPAMLSTDSYFNFHNQQLPPCSPLTPSCAYYNTDTPSFIYPQDHLPPTSTFTASLAQDLLQEETHKAQPLNEVQPQTRYYDIASILSLPQQKCEVKTFDLFDKVVDQQDPSIFDLYKSVMTADLLSMNKSQQPLEVKTCPEIPTVPIQPLPKPEEAQSNKRKKQHECQYCGKTFRQKSTLTTHERIHTGEKPYHCQYCSKSFSDNSTFVKHVRTHTREKPYTCQTCGKSFAQSGNLNRHNKIHLKTH